MKLIVLEQFRDSLSSKLTEEQLAGLEQSILADGVLDPVVVWPDPQDETGVIVDGHHRREICERHGLPFPIVKMHFESENLALAWSMRKNINRRNLTAKEQALERGKIYNLEKDERCGNSRMAEGKVRENVDGSPRCQVGIKEDGDDKESQTEPSKTAKALAPDLKVSARTLIRDGKRAEVHEAVKGVSEAAAQAAKDLPIGKVEAAAKAAKKAAGGDKEAYAQALASELIEATKVKIDGACDELIGLVQSGDVSLKTAKQFVEVVPGVGRQRESVAKGASAIKAVVAEAKKKQKEKAAAGEATTVSPKSAKAGITENDILAWLESATDAQRKRISCRAYKRCETETRSAIFTENMKVSSEDEVRDVIAWSRKQPAKPDDPIDSREIQSVVERVSSEANQEAAVQLVGSIVRSRSEHIREIVKSQVILAYKASDLFSPQRKLTRDNGEAPQVYSDAFEKFWMEYPGPRKREKQKTYKAFSDSVDALSKLKTVIVTDMGGEVDVSTRQLAAVFLLTRTELFAKSDTVKRGFAPEPQRWLANARYFDDAASWDDAKVDKSVRDTSRDAPVEIRLPDHNVAEERRKVEEARKRRIEQRALAAKLEASNAQ